MLSRFPLSKRINNEKRLKKIFNHLEAGVKCIEELRHYMSLMSYNNLRDIKEMELNRLLRFIAEHSTIYHFVLDDINRIISAQLWHDTNLTVKYYFDLIYHWLGQYRLVYKQTKLINMPKEKLLLEKQITIIAQYFQPHVSYSIIDTWLNDIAQEVLSRLKNKYPTHSAFSTSSEQFTLWRDNNINDNFWNPTEAKQIMCILEEIIFSDLGVHQICQLLVTLDVEEKFIYYYNLLGCRECLLSIAYHSIARRLGLHCFVAATFLRYRCHFAMAILWGPKYYTEGCQSVEYFYMTKYPSDDSDIDRGICRVMCPLDPLYNISQIRNLIYNLCKLKYNYPLWFDLQVKHQVSYKWKMILKFLSHSLSDDIEDMHMDYEYTYITRLIKDRFNIVINDQPEIRKKEIKFTIGMIVTHRKSSCYPFVECNMDDGVIIGWHYKCKAAFVCKNLNSLIPYLMNVCYIIQRHRRSRRYQIRKYNCRFICQPHYIILTDQNKLCYVPQDAVSICPPRWINNVEIGRYFSKFEGTYYVPNENLARNYPNDIAVMHEIFSNQ